MKGPLITLRYVTAGKKGTITFVVKIDTNSSGTSRWTITSGTKAYKGLHGEGIETENADYTRQHADRHCVALTDSIYGEQPNRGCIRPRDDLSHVAPPPCAADSNSGFSL